MSGVRFTSIHQVREQPAQLRSRLEELRFGAARRNPELGSDFFLNARVDAFHVITDDLNKATAQAIERSNAYAAAGADCIFYLFLHSAEIIGRLAKEVAAPISILAGPQSPSVQQLQDLGVARVSYGSGFTKAAITEVKRLAQEIQQNGTCNLLKNAMQTAELAALAARSTSVV